MTLPRKPRIGLTLDREEPGGYSKLPWYAIRENYCEVIAKFGGAPLPLPSEEEAVEAYLALIDGLIITGGAFDVPPSMYGEASQHETIVLKQKRSQFEFAITRGALNKKIPILGICGGQQLLNVMLGGTLIQHIPDSVKNALAHEQPNPRTEPGHSVEVKTGTLLHRIVGKDTIEVNSAHHQAVARPAPNTVVNAVAPDGVIEGIELADYPFCLGVQWHPEYEVTEADSKIIKVFLENCEIA